MLPVLVGGGIILVFIIAMIVIRNGVIAKKNKTEEAFSDIDVQMKKRFDLIPNLVETVKAYMKHEKDTLVELTRLRTQAMSGGLSANEQIQVANKVNRMGRGLMFQMENYPDLKASKNFLQLQSSWNEVEEQLSASRRFYNAAVNDYNNALEQFPSNIFARQLHYYEKEYIEIPAEERKNISAKDMFAV